MSDDLLFELLMDRLRQGDEAAARQIFERYARRLIGLARSRMDPAIRQKIDPEDVMQSAFKSFFVRHAEGQFDLEGWDGLWSLLAVITLRKCGHKVGYFRAACRDVHREAQPPTGGDDSSASWETVAREPTPSEAAVLVETLEQVLHGLEECDREVVELAHQGYKAPEISTGLGRAERTVYRLLGRIQKRLQGVCAEDAVAP